MGALNAEPGGESATWIHLLPDKPPAASGAATANGAASAARTGGDGVDDSSAPGADPRLFRPGWEEEDVIHVELRDEWRDTPLRVADRCNLVGELLPCGCGGTLHRRCTILDRARGPYLILRPDTLVSGTDLAVACTCPRKAALGGIKFDADLGEKLGT